MSLATHQDAAKTLAIEGDIDLPKFENMDS
jgi:hypothetical protein